MSGLKIISALLLVTSVAQAADLARRPTAAQRRSTVLPGLEQHPALSRLDLQFCGSGSEAQISRGPLGCGFPVVGDHPWLVSLGFSGPDNDTRFSCTGALISDQHVVTTARCALGARGYRLSTVRLGEYDFASRRDCLWYEPDLCTEYREAAVASVAVHPAFVKRGGDASRYDVAVVQLAAPVRLEHGVRPICLPMFPLRSPPHRQLALSMGLHSGPQPSADADADADADAPCCQCDRDRSTTSHVMDHEKLAVHNTSYTGPGPCQYRLLAETDGGADQCLGSGTSCVADLGGPLVAADRFGSAFYLLGVASVRPAQRACRLPGVAVTYASVRPHVRWILDSMVRLASC